MVQSPDSSIAYAQYLKNTRPRAFSARLRSLELTISNQTNSATLIYAGEYLESGMWFQDVSQSIIKPSEKARGYVANKQGAPTGVKGGLSFTIATEGADSNKFLIIGFKNPLFGGYKMHISIEDQNEAKIGCENAVDDNHKFKTQGEFQLEASQTASFEGGNKNIHFVIIDT